MNGFGQKFEWIPKKSYAEFEKNNPSHFISVCGTKKMSLEQKSLK